MFSAALLAPVLAMRSYLGNAVPERLAFPQQCLQKGFYQMFPQRGVADGAFPLVGILVFAPLFTDFREWLNAESYDVRKNRGSVLPYPEDQDSPVEECSMELSSAPVAPRSFGKWVSAQMTHFVAAWLLALVMGPRAILVFPLDQDMPQGSGVTYAATFSATYRGSLVQQLSKSLRLVRALLGKLWPAALYLQKAMHPWVYRISRYVHVAFLTVAILLVFWTDCLLPMRYVAGFSDYCLFKGTRVLHPVAAQAFLLQEYLRKDAAIVME